MSTEDAAAAPPETLASDLAAAQAPAPSPERPPAQKKPRPLLEWFWRGHALRNARGAIASERALRGELEDRARTAAEFGRRALTPGQARAAGSADAIACELYLQAAYWALLALGNTEPGAPPNRLPFDLKAAMSRAPRDLLLHAAGDALSLEEVELAAAHGDYCGASQEEQARVALRLQHFADNLLSLLTVSQQQVWLLRAQRLTRLSMVLVALAAVVGSALLTLDWLEQRRDLARDKAWFTSTSSGGACNSPAQFCDESPDFFFHTAEEMKPWLVIDLGAATQFSQVRVINRRDCCRERAAPLVIESSNDQNQWKQLARNESTFSSWKATFPAERARYVRVRIMAPRPTNLHLFAVRVLP